MLSTKNLTREFSLSTAEYLQYLVMTYLNITIDLLLPNHSLLIFDSKFTKPVPLKGQVSIVCKTVKFKNAAAFRHINSIQQKEKWNWNRSLWNATSICFIIKV